MHRPVQVTVLAMDSQLSYTLVGVRAMGRQGATFDINYDEATDTYKFRQTGENNEWKCSPDERK